ncbi:hypothetical protein [Salibacterium sp. K-3]
MRKFMLLLLALVLTACSGGEETLNPIDDEPLMTKYERLSENFQDNNGMPEEQAQQEAFDLIVQEAALVNRAQDEGIEVTDEEAREEAQSVRKTLENGDGPNTESSLQDIEETMEKENLTEDEYWNEYVISGYKHSLMKEKLRDHEKENEPKPWNTRRKEIVEAFRSDEAERIERFREEVGIEEE